MSSRLIATICIFPVWLILVLVFRKHRQWLLYYLIAAFGFTIQAVFLAEYFGIDQLIVNIASFQVSLIAKEIFKFNVELLSGGSFQLFPPNHVSSILKLGIECSAVLESAVLIALIAFYPLFNLGQKILRVSFGLVVTYVINIIRLMIIVFMTYKFGSDYIFISHALIARAFFFLAELILYWYLITKPTVKSVGDAIKSGVEVEQTAIIGRSLRLRHALGQISVILLVIMLTLVSFNVSNDWTKSFVSVKPSNRPLIYSDETGIVTTTKDSQLPGPEIKGTKSPQNLKAEINLDLGPDQKETLSFDSEKDQEIYIQIPKGKAEIAARLIINNQNIKFITAPSWVYTKEKSLFDEVALKTGDKLTLKLQNISAKSDRYLVKIFPKESLAAKTKSQSSRLEEMVSKMIAGATTTRFGKTLTLDLASDEKTILDYEVNKAGKINVQVVDGRRDIAARIYLNDVDIGFVTVPAWLYRKQDSLFLPISVLPGDRLKIRWQNISTVSDTYLVKVYFSKEESGQ